MSPRVAASETERRWDRHGAMHAGTRPAARATKRGPAWATAIVTAHSGNGSRPAWSAVPLPRMPMPGATGSSRNGLRPIGRAGGPHARRPAAARAGRARPRPPRGVRRGVPITVRRHVRDPGGPRSRPAPRLGWRADGASNCPLSAAPAAARVGSGLLLSPPVPPLSAWGPACSAPSATPPPPPSAGTGAAPSSPRPTGSRGARPAGGRTRR